jgi:hypothetical protein
MDVFVLILFVTLSSFGGNAGGLTSIEFNSQADCEAAKQVVLERFNRSFHRASAVCVPKSPAKN